MMRGFFIAFISCLMCLSFSSDHVLIWKGDRLLKWSDFKKRTGPEELYKAFTYSGIQFEVKGQGELVSIRVTPYFDPQKSWVHTAHLDSSLLTHEQGHFDLTALTAAQMNTELQPYRSTQSEFVKNNYMDTVQLLYDRLFDELDKRQQLYDRETVHGTSKGEQLRWNAWIENEMIEQGLRGW